ncbi:MAG: DUF3575 domain-containing protein [Muribaculaceae bacterium]|nr:DUF3575 domain-containing protein [Muribaculaceae bacterium]
MASCITSPVRFLALLLLATAVPAAARASAPCDSCYYDCLHVAMKTNLLHDAALTPDFGLEIALPRHISVGVEGVYAWWSNASEHRYWRLRGIWADVSYWFGRASRRRALTGHHIGIYGSCHDFDFEFGNKGWQSRRPTFGAGISYGYSFRLNHRLNLDLSVRAGYTGGHITVYRPECGKYVCLDNYYRRYVGITGLAVTLVWFPGRGSLNNPAR